MKYIGNIFAFLLVVAILAALGWGGYQAFHFLVSQYGMLGQEIAAALLISSVVLFISALVVAGAIRSLDKGSDREIYPEKAVLYNRFIENWYGGDREARVKGILELEPHMLLWAGDQVLADYLALLEVIREEEGPDALSEHAREVVVEIRKDLGFHNRNVGSDVLHDLLAEQAG